MRKVRAYSRNLFETSPEIFSRKSFVGIYATVSFLYNTEICGVKAPYTHLQPKADLLEATARFVTTSKTL